MKQKILIKNDNFQEIEVEKDFAQKFINKELVQIVFEKPFYLKVLDFHLDLTIENLKHFLHQHEVSHHRISSLTHDYLKTKNYYGNISFLSPEGDLMFKANSKKAFWYLYKDLVEIENSDPKNPVLKFKFNPNGFGHDKKYFKEELKNHCVCCNEKNFLTRHHVVPYAFRKFMPNDYKEHNAHDVLLLCTACHNTYELKADKKLDLIFSKYEDVKQKIKEVEKKQVLMERAKKIVFKLKSPSHIDYKDKIKQNFFEKLPNLNKVFDLNLNKDNCFDIIENYQFEENKENLYEIHIKELISKNELDSFIYQWREHFIQTMQPKYLNVNWSVSGPVKKVKNN